MVTVSHEVGEIKITAASSGNNEVLFTGSRGGLEDLTVNEESYEHGSSDGLAYYLDHAGFKLLPQEKNKHVYGRTNVDGTLDLALVGHPTKKEPLGFLRNASSLDVLDVLHFYEKAYESYSTPERVLNRTFEYTAIGAMAIVGGTVGFVVDLYANWTGAIWHNAVDESPTILEAGVSFVAGAILLGLYCGVVDYFSIKSTKEEYSKFMPKYQGRIIGGTDALEAVMKPALPMKSV
ncbi:hypothetical protein HZB02_06650 [Candidatus Woesearchaeota archaeon]|nr:hypothetical protein [Candidatus Woesearchaeota archaeon]